MSDFDDEPIEGADANEIEAEEPASTVPEAEVEPAPADDAPDEPAAKDPAPNKPKPKSDDDWDDDWDQEDNERGPKRDLTLVYAIVAATIVIVLAVVLTNKDDTPATTTSGNNNPAATQPTAPNKNWQGPVGDAVGENGKDAQARAESAPGVYIWTDFGGWHLRNNGTSEVSVTVTADTVKVKKSDDGDDGDEDGTFATEATFTLPAGGGEEGVGLDLGQSERATFTVTIDGRPVAATEIKLGGADGQADQNPITFIKA